MLKNITGKDIVFGLIFSLIVPAFINITNQLIELTILNKPIQLNTFLPTFHDIFFTLIMLIVFVKAFTILRQRFSSTIDTPNNITQYREELGLSRQEFAQLCGITSQSLSVIECGKHSPSLELAQHIANKLNKSVDEVFTFNKKES